jgi:ubiquinone/menaquinone biosynthesis C-methylase UbiE
MTSSYLYDQGWSDERARLAGIEAMWDLGTRDVLARHGAVAGAAALEVGAGGGSIVEWLADELGADGHVLATDLDTRFFDRLASDVVEVRRADVLADELPENAFDVVHTRLVLEHLPARDAALDRMVRALKPGGWLVVEDYDWTSFGFDPDGEVETRAANAVVALMTQAGFDAAFGRRVVSALAARGLEDVAGEGRALVIDSGHPGSAFFTLSFAQLAPATVQAGLLTDDEVTTMRARLQAGDWHIFTPTMVAAIGRKPGTAQAE